MSLGYYTALQGVGSYWKSFTVYILLYWLVTQRKKEHCKLSDMHGNEHFVSECSCHGLFFFCKRKKKERICLTQDKKPHQEDKERVMNLQQGHIIMQWPSQAHLHRWVELVSLDHKSTHGRSESVTDIIQQDGWISESQVTFTNLPDRKKITLPPYWSSFCVTFDRWIISVACGTQAINSYIKQSWLMHHTAALKKHCRLNGTLGVHDMLDFLYLSIAKSLTWQDPSFDS